MEYRYARFFEQHTSRINTTKKKVKKKCGSPINAIALLFRYIMSKRRQQQFDTTNKKKEKNHSQIIAFIAFIHTLPCYRWRYVG